MSYQLKVIKDYPVAFWLLDETSGSTASDYSGCGNDGTYSSSIISGIMPLVPGGQNGTIINNTQSITFPIINDYTGEAASGEIATTDSSDNDFSLEVWFYPKITTSNVTTIFADDTKGVGIFWESGSILFRLNNEYLYYTPPYIKKSFYVVAIYNITSMILYVDGKLVASKALSNFKFENASFTLYSGPTASSSDSFIIDAPAVYRYSLNETKVVSHYFNSFSTPPIQIVKPDGGSYFGLSDQPVRCNFRYSYPYSRSWKAFVNEDINYDPVEESISLIKNSLGGSKTVTFTDYITVPTEIELTSSKVEWDGDNGVSVYTSLDGITYSQCVNGKAIPQYKLSSFDTVGKLYIKFVLSSSDLSKHIPKLKNLTFSFFQNKDVVGYNTGSKVVYAHEEYHLGAAVYDILFRDSKNGLRCDADGGFVINTNKEIRTVEFFYTPSGFTDSGLVSSASTNGYDASNYSWRNSGTVSKTNISAIYVNGVNKTSETSISNVFKDGELHHVILVYGSNISGDITFNYSLYGATESLYQNVAIYESAFNQAKAQEHYSLYTSFANQIADDSTLTMTESSVKYYNNDWVVIQSI